VVLSVRTALHPRLALMASTATQHAAVLVAVAVVRQSRPRRLVLTAVTAALEAGVVEVAV